MDEVREPCLKMLIKKYNDVSDIADILCTGGACARLRTTASYMALRLIVLIPINPPSYGQQFNIANHATYDVRTSLPLSTSGACLVFPLIPPFAKRTTVNLADPPGFLP